MAAISRRRRLALVRGSVSPVLTRPPKDHAPAIRRRAVVVDHPPAVRDDPSGREQAAHQGRVQRLGRDHVAADRDDAAPVPRRQGAAVAIGREHDVTRADRAVRRADGHSVRAVVQRLCRCSRCDHCPCRHHAGKQPRMVPPGIEHSVVVKYRAAVVEVGSELPPLLRSRNQRDLLAVGEPSEIQVGTRMSRRVKAPACGEVAIDPLVAHEALDIFTRGDAVGHHRACRLGPVPPGQRLEARFDRGAYLPAVACRASLPRLAGLQHHDRPPRARDPQRGVKAGVARAHHDRIGRRRQRRALHPRRRGPFPPVGRRRQVIFRRRVRPGRASRRDGPRPIHQRSTSLIRCIDRDSQSGETSTPQPGASLTRACPSSIRYGLSTNSPSCHG